MAEASGVDTRFIYSMTLASAPALAGVTGGLYAPTMTLVPTMGAQFIMEAFVTVVIGGADIFLGTAPAGVVLGCGQVRDDLVAGAVVRPDRTADRRDHRHPGAAEGHLRLHPARDGPEGRAWDDAFSLRFPPLLEGPQTLGPRSDVLDRRGHRSRARRGLSAVHRWLHGRQHRLFLHLGRSWRSGCA